QVSPSWRALTGWSEAETLGREYLDLMHPNERDLVTMTMLREERIKAFQEHQAHLIEELEAARDKADAASQGKLFIEAQRKEGYDDSFSVAITAVSAVLAVVIPPSILMIVWGGVLTVSIGGLFLAGIIPGLLLGAVQMGTVHVYAKRRGYPTYPKATWGELAHALFISVPALMTPFIIIGGKIFGWFTATEAACIAVLYAAVLSLVVYRELDGKGLYNVFSETGRFAAITLFCVGTASAFGWLLAFYKIPEGLLAGVSTWNMGVVAAGFFIAGVFLVVGCFLDAIPAIIIVGTILQPIAAAAGMHPIHFAMISIVSLAFGLVTPPYGLCVTGAKPRA
ncbi:MAG: TRAP transporter large permease subunit, partial [Alphaproteobacteria bacterium]|nr:TRAP transporter large permease subunit [Alphaproteobacteria bacterium]